MCYFCNLKKDQFYVKEESIHTHGLTHVLSKCYQLQKHPFWFVIKMIPRLAVPWVYRLSVMQDGKVLEICCTTVHMKLTILYIHLNC